MGLIAFAADQVGILVGLEVRQAHDHGMGRESSPNGGDALGQFLHIKRDRIRIAGGMFIDETLELGVLAVILQ